ncbi:MAG: HAD family hydrolase [Candidatus Magasanikbacteria bacterium]|nr:HAD family hydrolase [Candidatus Magasanikbacteria bacterium]
MSWNIKAITFDFDGVIVADSEYIKEDSWEAVIAELGESARQPLATTRQTFSKGKGSRFDIIEAALKDLKMPATEIIAAVPRLAQVYNRAVQTAILEKGIRPVDREGIAALAKHCPLYINSATPEIAVQETVRRLGVELFFKGVFGQPTKKVENLQRVIAEENIKPMEMLFVGDGDGDVAAATEAGCRFIGLANSWNKWQSPKLFPLIANLTEALAILTKV